MSIHPSLIILLHGVGSNGDDLAHLGDIWLEMLPRSAVVAPDAPFPFNGGSSGYQWFSIAGVTPANRPQRIRAARAAFDATLTALIEEQGFAGKLDQVALVGFSQGAIMALDALASGRWPVRAVVAFAGRLATEEPLSPPPGSAALLVHGEADRMIPASETVAAAATLQRHGVEVESHIEPGVDHTISPDGALMAAAFLARRLAIPVQA
jgi:phospholipase/carboxylesterase